MSRHTPDLTDSLRVATLGAWAGGFVWLLWGNLPVGGASVAAPPYQTFIRAELWPLLAGGLVLLLLFMLAAFVQVGRGQIRTGNGATRSARAALLLLPLIYALAAPPVGLGSYAFQKRYVSTVARDGAFDGAPSSAPALQDIAGADDSIKSVNLLDLLYDLEALEGRRVVTEGRVSQDPEWPAGHFMVFRFVILCCAADARPVGALVQTPDVEKFPTDTWVRVVGTVRIKTFNDLEDAVIEAESIEPIEAPKQPYLYPR